jgi:hypothetical protein
MRSEDGMARVIDNNSDSPAERKAWLKLAADVRRSAEADVYRHAPDAAASIARVRALAGIIRLKGSVPSWKFLEDDSDGT